MDALTQYDQTIHQYFVGILGFLLLIKLFPDWRTRRDIVRFLDRFFWRILLAFAYVYRKWDRLMLPRKSLGASLAYSRLVAGNKIHYLRNARITRSELQGYGYRAKEKSFRPWIGDYLKALLIAVAGIACAVLTGYFYKKTGSYSVFGLGVTATVILFAATLYLESGQRRSHGKTLELESCKSFLKIMPDDWDVIPTGLLRHVGDVDLPLRMASDNVCTVEIKSWHSWSGRRRTQKALHQARRQQRAVNATFSVIWLPAAKREWVSIQQGVLIVCGSASCLLGKLFQHILYETSVKFPYEPGESILDTLKENGFRYDSLLQQWIGSCSPGETDQLAPHVRRYGGVIISDVPDYFDEDAYGFIEDSHVA